MTLNEAQLLANSLLEEDPKGTFRKMRSPDPRYRVTITVYDRQRQRHTSMGRFDVDLSSGKISNQVFSPHLTLKPSQEDFEGIIEELKVGHFQAGHYPVNEPWPGRFHWEAKLLSDTSRYRPVLFVETPQWTIHGPLIKGTEHQDYAWQFKHLTPEQHDVMARIGEFIHYGMNEGSTFRGVFDDLDEFPGLTVSWRVSGNPDLAPDGIFSGDWSGEVKLP